MLFPLTDAPAVGYRVVEPPPHPARDPLPPGRADAIARALLDALPLLPAHREALLTRGLSEDEVLARRYRSLPRASRRDAVERLAGLFPSEELLRFPGFSMKQGRYAPYLSLGGAEGLLVPVRDAEGRIVAFRIRPDRAGGGGKYRWMSSRAHGGPSPGTPIHVARPIAASVAFDPGAVYVTEGEIKADLAANRLGAVVLSVPGVSIRAGVADAVRALGARRVVLAFDADKATKPQVLSAEVTLARELRLAGIEVLAAAWPLEKGKGIDDLLAAGGTPAIAPYPFPREVRPASERLEAVAPEWVEARLPAPPPVIPIEEARGLVRAEVERRIGGRVPGLLVVRGTPGVGKTTIALRALQDMIAAGALDGRRVLVSMERLDLIEEVLTRGEFAGMRGAAAVRHGRTDDKSSPGHCADVATARALARRRQGVMRSYCAAEGEARCPFAAGCPYLAHLRRARKAQVVFAATALLRTEASELADFDVIVVDEAIDAALVEPLHVTRDDVDLWARAAGERRGGERGPAAEGDLTPFLRILAHALAEAPPSPAEARRAPLRPVLDRAASLLGLDPAAAVKAALAAPTDRDGRLPCEVPRREGEGGATSLPLRGLREVAEVLDRELSRPQAMEPSATDTRAWIVGGGGRGGEDSPAPAMEFRIPRRRLIEVLSRATTINLDATPNLPLLGLAFPKLDVLSVSVPEPVEVTQLVDALYVSATVEKHAERIGEVLARHFDGAARPAVFCEKRFRPDLPRKAATPPQQGAAAPHHEGTAPSRNARPVLSVARKSGGAAVLWGHFGGNSRGTNAFSDVDAMAIVGHFLPPIDEAEADVRALRFAAPPPAPGPEEILVPYSGRTTDGRKIARWVRRHPDPDVAEVLDARRTAMIRQVIGRARPSLRSAEAPPLRVLLAAGWPVPEVPVVRLATRAELSRDGERKKPADAAISFAAVSQPTPQATLPPLAEVNARRHEAFVARVDGAVAAIGGRGEGVSAKGISRELDLTSGRSVTRIAQLLGRTGRIPSSGGTPQALKRTFSAPRGVPPVDGSAGWRRLPPWIAAPRGRSGRWKVVRGSDRPFAISVYSPVRGPPTLKLSHLQEVLVGIPRKAALAGQAWRLWIEAASSSSAARPARTDGIGG